MSKHQTFDFHLAPRFEELIADQKETCNTEFQIGRNTKGQGWNKCRDRCTSNAECNFYFFTTKEGWCSLYSACHKRRTPGLSGSTFMKTGTSFKFELRILSKAQCFIGTTNINVLQISK